MLLSSMAYRFPSTCRAVTRTANPRPEVKSGPPPPPTTQSRCRLLCVKPRVKYPLLQLPYCNTPVCRLSPSIVRVGRCPRLTCNVNMVYEVRVYEKAHGLSDRLQVVSILFDCPFLSLGKKYQAREGMCTYLRDSLVRLKGHELVPQHNTIQVAM